jgi:hypothetical protein
MESYDDYMCEARVVNANKELGRLKFQNTFVTGSVEVAISGDSNEKGSIALICFS